MSTDTLDEAKINQEILDALTNGEITGAVRVDGPPTLHEIISKGEGEFEAPIVSKVYQDAGVTTIYDLRTGEPSLTSVNMLPAQLKKVGPDGKRMFTHAKPATAPKLGTLKCLLHADERKAEYDDWGLPTCPKSNITSPMQVQQHMEHRHKVEWKTIRAEIERLDKEEERDLQRQIARAAVGRAEPAGKAE